MTGALPHWSIKGGLVERFPLTHALSGVIVGYRNGSLCLNCWKICTEPAGPWPKLAQNGMPSLTQSGREGLQQSPKAQDDDHDAHQDHQRAIRETAGHIGCKGRCQHPTKDQSSDDRPEIQADGEDEGC